MLLNACKDIGLAVNIGKTKYVEIGRHRRLIANESTVNSQVQCTTGSLGDFDPYDWFGSLHDILK